MLCQNCGKRPATMRFTNIINGVKTEYSLCEQCAAQSTVGQVEIQDLISGFFGMQTKQSAESLTCSFCHSTLAQIKKRGKAGCSQCYQVFSSYLDPIVRKVHGSDIHVGKRPIASNGNEKCSGPSTAVDEELKILQMQMQKAVAEENYEEAARLRDAIAMHQKKGAEE